MRRTLRVRRFLLLLGVWATPASGQSPQQRAALDAFRDSLLQATEAAPLEALEAGLMRAAKERPEDPILHLRQGFLSLRLGDLGQLRHYDDAAAEFQWAVDLEPAWPYGWFALGLAEYELGKLEGPGSRRTSILGRDASQRAAAAFMRAALADPGFAARLEILAAQAVRRRDAPRAGVVLDALRQAMASQPAGRRAPAILLALGRVEREIGDLPAALNAFETYRRLGDNRALGLLEVARTRFLLGQLEGTEAYYEGAAMDDLVALAGYRADLEVIAPIEVLARFDGSRGRERAAVLAAFWAQRDQLDFRPEGSRLREHYRRLAYARRHYSAGGWSLPSDPAFLGNDAALDDRGRLYVRHGEPDARASLSTVGVEPNESWHYRRAGGDLVFHFVARQDPERYRLVESLLEVIGSRPEAPSAPTDGGGWREATAGVSDQLVRSRAAFASVYTELGPARAGRGDGALERERGLVRSSLVAGLSTDSHEPRFGRDLAARLQAVATAAGAAGPQVHILVAVPGFGLVPEETPGGVRYPMRLRLVGIDGRGEVRLAVDTVLAPVTGAPIRPERYLQEVVSVAAPAGVTLTYRVGLFVGEQRGSVSPIDTLTTLPASSDALRLGDLILGGSEGSFRASGATLLPMQGLSRSERLRVFAEIVGLAGEGRWRARLVLRHGETGAVAQRVEWTGRGGVVERELGIRGVAPGRYLAVLEVTDQAERWVARSRRVLITAP